MNIYYFLIANPFYKKFLYSDLNLILTDPSTPPTDLI